MKARTIVFKITELFLLSLLLIACGTNTPSNTTPDTTPTPTIDQITVTADQATSTPTTDQATPTPTIDQASPTPTTDQAVATPTPPQTPEVSASSLNPRGCNTTSTGWDCSLSLSNPSKEQVDWSVSSPDIPTLDISYSPSSGTLSADNQYQQTVIISITSNSCQDSTSGTIIFSFMGKGQDEVKWTCS